MLINRNRAFAFNIFSNIFLKLNFQFLGLLNMLTLFFFKVFRGTKEIENLFASVVLCRLMYASVYLIQIIDNR
jgi:hypothetical protein